MPKPITSTTQINRALPLDLQERMAHIAGLTDHVNALLFQTDSSGKVWVVSDWHDPILIQNSFLVNARPDLIQFDPVSNLLAIAVENGKALYRLERYTLGPLVFWIGHLVLALDRNGQRV